MKFPRHMYVQSKKAAGYEGFIVKNEAHRAQLEKQHGKLHESPADFGVETHPNPDEVKPEPAKEPEKAQSQRPAGK